VKVLTVVEDHRSGACRGVDSTMRADRQEETPTGWHGLIAESTSKRPRVRASPAPERFSGAGHA
jgi:hypothetical protein